MEDKKNIEHLFSDGMKNHEVPYQEGSWEKMEELLEKEDRKPLWIIWFGKRNNQLKTILIMTVVGIIAAWSIFNLFGINESEEISKRNTIKESEIAKQEVFIQPKINKSQNTVSNDKEVMEAKAFYKDGKIVTEAEQESAQFNSKSNKASAVSIGSKAASKTGQEVPEAKPIISKEEDGSFKQLVNNTKTDEREKEVDKVIKTTKDILKGAHKLDSNAKIVISRKDTTIVVTKVIKVEHKEWVEERYTYNNYYDSKKPIKDFWMGIHYTEQAAAGQFSQRRSGFNLQLMSGNIAKNKEKHALYAGLDWGMMFYGRSANSNVVINTVNEDSGYTRLRNNSTDFFFRMHYEYPKHRIVPYITLNAGPRFYYTNQKVASYLNLADNESQTRHNADFNVSMMAGLGIGTRIKIADRISLDLRYERVFGTRTNQVDLDQTSFNGLSYNLVRNNISPNEQMFKVGLIFDLSEDRSEKELIKGHYVTTSRDSMIVENTSDTTVIVIPCNCDCDKKEKNNAGTNKFERNEEMNEDEDNGSFWNELLNEGSNNGSSGGNSKGGKGKFPGVKQKPPVLK